MVGINISVQKKLYKFNSSQNTVINCSRSIRRYFNEGASKISNVSLFIYTNKTTQ